MSEKASKGRFFKLEKLQNDGNEGKGKEERRKKTMVALLAFIVGTLEVIFGQKNLFEAKGPFGDNVLKNPARYM